MKWRLKLLVIGSLFAVCPGFVSRPHSHCPWRILPVLLMEQGNPSDSAAAAIRKCKTVTHVLQMMGETDEPNSNAAALRRLSDLISSTSRRQRLSEHDRIVAKEKILVLLETLDQVVNNDSVELNVHVLVDTLTSLSKLPSNVADGNKRSLATRICLLMDESEHNHLIIKNVKPNRLVECLQSLAALELYHSSLVGRICHRLQQGDALAMVDPRHLASGIKAMAPLEHVHENVFITMRAFMRRWRKQAVRQSATTRDVCQALYAARLSTQEHPAHAHDTEMSTMVHTLLRELHSPSPNTTASCSLTAGQVAEALMTASAFQVNATNPVFDHFIETLLQERTMERASIPDIARILLSMERLHLFHYPPVVQRLGHQFLNLVQEESVVVEPKSVCNILRNALRLHQRNEHVMEPFKNASRHLILYSSFLQDCSGMELSSLVRFLCLVRCDEEQVLASLAERILEPHIVESCSPKAASQILAYFTMWTHASTEELPVMRSFLTEMFHELGIHLLSTQLTSAETSASMQAYAKASYVQDMGIFDHLASHLISLLDSCTIRQVVQALWACGKMRLWEADQHGEEQDQSGPPYMEAAREYVVFLAPRVSQLNSKDTTQALWALGRLGIDDAGVISALALRARQVSPELTSREASTILWGLSRVGCDDREVISALTNRMLELQPSSQEAATVLYSLGLLQVPDEKVFLCMSNAMMDQLETASAQAIANALWAYRTVEIPPPRELMDSWVIRKLGLDSVAVIPIEDL